MQKILAGLTLVLFAGAASDEADVRRAFDEYRKALDKGDGLAAFALIDSRSQDYYDQLLDKTRHATPAECASYSVLDKLSILLGRVSIPKESLAEFNGETYFRYALEQGWVSLAGDKSVEVDRVEIEGDDAKLFISREGEVSPFPQVFRREGGTWRLSIIDMLPIAEASLQQHLNRVGVQEQDFLFDTVEAAIGTRPTQSTWEPPFRRTQ